MPEDIFVKCCAPTLAGIKTGSLFSCPYEDKETLYRELRGLNRSLGCYGLRILAMRLSGGRALLYLYRPSRLARDLSDRQAREILVQSGYDGLRLEECVPRLVRRLREGEGFPHEIGLFLSYPPEDVRGFMEHHGHDCKLTGYWKVYGNESAARKTFEQYRKCTDSYCRHIREGCTLASLAVASA